MTYSPFLTVVRYSCKRVKMCAACPVDQRRSIDGDEDIDVDLMRAERAEGPRVYKKK